MKCLGTKADWNIVTLEECVLVWLSDMTASTYKSLPCLFVNSTWSTMNQLLFQDKEYHIAMMAHKIRMVVQEHKKNVQRRKRI
jgi:hypothetical protein